MQINTKTLKNALNKANKISVPKSDIEEFTLLKVKIKDNTIEMVAVSQSLYFSTKLEAEGEEDIEFDIKTNAFFGAVSTIKDEFLNLEIGETKLVVAGNKTKHTLRFSQGSRVIQYPEKNDLEATVEVSTVALQEAFKVSKTTVGLPKNVYQPQFLAVCLTVQKDELVLVSSDKYRISKLVLPAKVDLMEEKNYLIHPKELGLILSSITSDTCVLKFYNSQLWVESDGCTFVARFSDGIFPDYNKILPQSFICYFEVDTAEMVEALKQVQFTARTHVINKTMHLEIKPNESKILFNSKTDDGYSSEAECKLNDYQGEKEDWTQAFNADYLMDYLSLITSEKTLLECNPGKPMIVSPLNKKAENLCLIQGLR